MTDCQPPRVEADDDAGAETAAHPPELDELADTGMLEVDGQPPEVEEPVVDATGAHPDFWEPLLSCSLGSLTADTVGGGASLMPAAFASLRISFSSRFLSFSLRFSASSLPPIFMGWLAFMSFMRTLW